MMTDLLAGLNEAQRAAVEATEGFVRVLAGAGSGKTRALTHRFAYLVEELGILPGHILCVTFTNKSAMEMRQRIRRLTGDDDTGYINTFHGFCVSVLQEDSHAVQYPKNFLVLDNADIDDMLQTIYEERGLTLRTMTFGQARDMIEIRKTFKEPDYYLDMVAMPLDELREKYRRATEPADIIFYGYLYQEKKCFGLDYNDLIIFTLFIFRQEAAIREKWQKRLEYIMIDEFQDIDELQYRLMEALCGYHKNLFVVGDPDQTIYTWRGASGRFLLDFEAHFSGAKTILMMQNYRSTPEILDTVNALIAKNRDRAEKDLIPTRPGGAPVTAHHAPAAEEEAAWIAAEIGRLHETGTPYRDIAVLYRAHYITRTVEEGLLKAEIPYTIYSGVQFFARREIKDALSYLRLIVYRDDLSFRRVANVPRRNLGKRRMAFLEERAAEQGVSLFEAMTGALEEPLLKGTGAAALAALVEMVGRDYREAAVSELLAAVLDASGYERMLRTEGSQERLDNLAELKQSVLEYETACGEESTAEHYLSHVALFSNRDAGDDGGDRVRLMTVHTAKGLEFPVVFLCGLNEGMFPSQKTRTRAAMEEERRLAFVAMTRARDRLYLTEAAGLHFDGALRYPSRFLLDIGPDRLHWEPAPPPADFLEEAARYAAARESRLTGDETPSDALTVGQRVEHGTFGAGTVVAVDESTCEVQFDNMATPRRLSRRVKLRRME